MDISGCLIKVMCSGNSRPVCCVNMSILLLCDIMYWYYMYNVYYCVCCMYFLDYLFCYSQSLIVSLVLSFSRNPSHSLSSSQLEWVKASLLMSSSLSGPSGHSMSAPSG